jgi:hypothetical protein
MIVIVKYNNNAIDPSSQSLLKQLKNIDDALKVYTHHDVKSEWLLLKSQDC